MISFMFTSFAWFYVVIDTFLHKWWFMDINVVDKRVLLPKSLCINVYTKMITRNVNYWEYTNNTYKISSQINKYYLPEIFTKINKYYLSKTITKINEYHLPKTITKSNAYQRPSQK